MKRVFVSAVIIVLGVGLFWWGQRSRSYSTVMSENSESSSAAVATTAQPQEVEAKDAEAENKNPLPQRQAATSGEELGMQSRGAPSEEHNGEQRVLARPRTGDQLISSSVLADTRWKIWPGVRAVPMTVYDGPEVNVIGRVGSFVVIADTSMNGDDRSFASENPWVVYNQRLQQAGVITGKVTVTLNEGASINDISRDYGLKIVSSFEQSRIYFVTAQAATFDLGSLLNVLKKDSRVSQAELEILSRNYEKN